MQRKKTSDGPTGDSKKFLRDTSGHTDNEELLEEDDA
jgi:hypothetical protein